MSLHLEQDFVVFLYSSFFFFVPTPIQSLRVFQEFTCGFLSQSGSFCVICWGGEVGYLPTGRWEGEAERIGGRSHHQFIMEFLLRVMKKTWLLPPERTDAKNTWRENIRHKQF